ncbi:MAG: pilin [Patescibacteria group bacterium]
MFKRLIILLFIIVFIVLAVLFFSTNNMAYAVHGAADIPGNTGGTPVAGPDLTNPGGIGGSTPGKRLANPLGDEQGDVSKVANNLIKAALGLTGVLAIIAFIWGGIEWMTSGGNEPRIKKGKDMMIWAVVGLVAIFGSYAILNLIFQALGG